ncbi:MAG: hypothetical protein ACK6D1_14585 [Planctomycetota bacterium]
MNPLLPRARVRRAAVAAATTVFALAWLAYGAALAGDFVFDDFHSGASNPALRDLGNLGASWTDPTLFSAGTGAMYRPALLTSFALNMALDPGAWSLKAGNVLLHASVAVLWFLWAWRLSRRLVASAVVAGLFAVHPLASEAINLVSARSELLAMVGALLALHGHLAWSRGAPAVVGIATTCLGIVIACGAKETGVVVPALCVLQGALAGHGGWRRRLLPSLGRAVPMVLVVVGYLLVRRALLGEATVQLLDRPGGDPLTGGGRTLLVQVATMGTLLPGCLLQSVWPWRLSFDPHVVYRTSLVEPAVLAGWATMAAVTLAAVWPGPTARLRRLGAAFAWAVALPWVLIPLNMPLAEHRLYGPLVGLGLVALAAVPRTLPAWSRRLPQPVGWSAVAVLVFAGIGRSTMRSLQYRDERLIWQQELAVRQDSFRAWWGFGTSSLRAGDAAGAVEALGKAHAIYPSYAPPLADFVDALLALPDGSAQPARAVAAAAALRAARPDDPWVRTQQAQALLQQGRVRGDAAAFAAAESAALACLAIAPPKAFVFRLAAAARRGLGDATGARAHLDRSGARGLAPVDLRIERAALLQHLGRGAEARQELLRAQQQAPGDLAVMQALQSLAAPPR